MMLRKLRIAGSGVYLPERRVTAAEVDERLGVAPGWTAANTGVLQRFYVSGETSSQMAAEAARRALRVAGLQARDLDLIVCASGVPQQAVPCTASFVQKELGLTMTPGFDLNCTCLSFVTALDQLAWPLSVGHYRHVLLVSSDIASVALNWEHKESAGLFGDGAAAFILSAAPANARCGVQAARLETYSDSGQSCFIEGGGTRLHPRFLTADNADRFLFNMDGPRVYKQAVRHLAPFVERLLEGTELRMSDMDLVVPHQASAPALELVRRRLDIPQHRWMTIVATHGNCVAASMPMALHEAIRRERLVRGQRVLLLGTGAGISVGGAVLEY